MSIVYRDRLSQEERATADQMQWWHSIKLSEDYTTTGQLSYGMQQTASAWGVPEDLTGLRVLDVGCWDGGFSFECERRGADVVGIDRWQAGHGTGMNVPLYIPDKLAFCQKVLNSSMEFVELDVTNAADYFGDDSFDIVLCYGVLYHVEEPLRVVESLVRMAKTLICVETAYDKKGKGADADGWVYSPGRGGDPYIYWFPTKQGLIRSFDTFRFSTYTELTVGPTRMACKFER
jgi:tRNA (mo5U34)-methyltransferase